MNALPDNLKDDPVVLFAEDGYSIIAHRYPATGELFGYLLVAGATGVPQRYYRRFARYAASKGFTTLTLDYRGTGESKPPSLKGFKATFFDWARLDLACAVETMSRTESPLFMVGHSFGGQALGLLPNHVDISKFYGFAVGAGWHGWMPFPENLRVRLLWNVLLPLLTAWKGYLPMSFLGMGEDLPLGVYRQWRHWCRFPHYFFDDPDLPQLAAEYASVRTPITAANATDDLWALPRSRDAFVSAFTGAPVTCLDIDPSDHAKGIGHMGYFSSGATVIWDRVLAWFKETPRTESG